MKKLPDILTMCRFALCIAAFFVMDKSAFLWLYIIAGATDVADGWLARRLNAVTTLGARLDSAADVFLAALSISYIASYTDILSKSAVWILIGAVAFVRVANLVSVRVKFGTWASTHTILNKVAGLLLFAVVPIAFIINGVTSGATVDVFYIWFVSATGVSALAASIEESAIILTTRSSDYDPDRRSIFR